VLEGITLVDIFEILCVLCNRSGLSVSLSVGFSPKLTFLANSAKKWILGEKHPTGVETDTYAF
jgi:hypothetical protein